MNSPVVPPVEMPAAVRVPAWAWLLVAFAVLALYLALQDNGALLSSAGNFVHEFTHDGRHSLGLPCH